MKTWFITGASRGFGRIWAEAALKRGDKVTATARKSEDGIRIRLYSPASRSICAIRTR